MNISTLAQALACLRQRLRPLRISFFLLTISCASSPGPLASKQSLQASRFQANADAEGFSRLWQAQEQRCQTLVASDRGNATTADGMGFKNCRSYEWQTSLYNSSTNPRRSRLTFRSQCGRGTSISLYAAVAAHPAELVGDSLRLRIARPWKEAEFSLTDGTDASFEVDIPSQKKAVVFAFIPAFTPSQSVPQTCLVQYRIEQAPQGALETTRPSASSPR